MNDKLFYNLIILFVIIIELIFYFTLIILYRYNKISNIINTISIIYKGFNPNTKEGILKGALWAIVDGMISGVIIAWVIRALN
ncbi:MAG: hypothetical protein K6348_01575 [Deferribacterales bacterium]